MLIRAGYRNDDVVTRDHRLQTYGVPLLRRDRAARHATMWCHHDCDVETLALTEGASAVDRRSRGARPPSRAVGVWTQ